MIAEKSRQATRYPPVTSAEERQATESASTRPSHSKGNGVGSDGKAIVDAMAAAFDEHRRRIGVAAIDPVAKKYVLELLDAVFLDLLQSVVDAPPLLELTPARRQTMP